MPGKLSAGDQRTARIPGRRHFHCIFLALTYIDTQTGAVVNVSVALAFSTLPNFLAGAAAGGPIWG